jgi:hypothetical protein
MRSSTRAGLFTLAIVLLLVLAIPSRSPGADERGDAKYPIPWKGVHILTPGHDSVPKLKRAIAEGLAPLGVNALIIEVNYNFHYRSHPELAQEWGLTRTDAQELAAVGHEHGIRLIPMFNCLGHQSWARETFPLLVKHPEFDETPEVPKDNKGIYCRSWCPRHPEVNKVVFDLMDELIDAFQADAFHVGMDEVFLIASKQCPRCKGQDPAEVFAGAVNDYHKHLVAQKHLTMLMWGDRLLDDRVMKYGKWEASQNGTAPAIDRISKDIVICDWHYEPRDSYPSVHYFQEKGFRVWPASWKDKEAALALLHDARKNATDRMVGQLCTTWVNADQFLNALLDEGRSGSEARKVFEALRAWMKEMNAKRER